MKPGLKMLVTSFVVTLNLVFQSLCAH